jgi:putative membrane protein
MDVNAPMPLLAALDYSIFPPLNAALNGLSVLFLSVGLVLIKMGRREAHRRVMLGALVSSALFLSCYLTYHYGTGHTTFPKEYPVARIIYLAILFPHIILAVANLPLIALLVVAAARGRFEEHKKWARITYPSWMFVSISGVVIYFMIYVWFPPGVESVPDGGVAPDTGVGVSGSPGTVTEVVSGGLRYIPAFATVQAEPGQMRLEVRFEVINISEAPVKVTKLESGCECLAVTIGQNPIPVGGSTAVIGVFDTEKMRGSSERRITVSTDQGGDPAFLTTRIEIEPVYTLNKEMTEWVIGAEPVTKVIEFRVIRDKPVHVLSAESKRAEVRCEVVEVEKGRAYDLRLTPESTAKRVLGIVRIETDCELEQHSRPLAYFSIQ